MQLFHHSSKVIQLPKNNKTKIWICFILQAQWNDFIYATVDFQLAQRVWNIREKITEQDIC